MANPRTVIPFSRSVLLAASLLGVAGCAGDGSPTDTADPTDGTTTSPQPTADTATKPTGTETADTGTQEIETPINVVVLAGQSNMLGRAGDVNLPVLLQQPQPAVELFYSGGGSLPANVFVELQPGSGTQLGPEVTLGDALLDLLPDEPFVLIKHAVGGTNLFDDWDPKTGGQYQTLLDTVDAGLEALVDQDLSPQIQGIAWLQGEADAVTGRSEAEYAADLTELIDAMRTDFGDGSNTRFVIGRLSDQQFANNKVLSAARETIQAAQDAVGTSVDNVAVVNTDLLGLSDDRHYDTLAQQALGTLFARALFPDLQTSTTARFDFGTTQQEASFEEPGTTPLQLTESGSAPTAYAVDAATGWTVVVRAADNNAIGRNRAPLEATVEGGFTLDALYADFVTGWDQLSIEGLDPSATYDVQVVMFDDDGSPGRTQTLTNVTDGASTELGTTDGPGTAGGGVLVDALSYSIVADGLSPDATGTLSFQCANSGTGNRCLSNGVILTER